MGGEGGVDRRRSHPLSAQSRMEMLTGDGIHLTDHQTAHHRAGDPDYTLRIPETCAACWAEAVAEAEAAAAAEELDRGK